MQPLADQLDTALVVEVECLDLENSQSAVQVLPAHAPLLLHSFAHPCRVDSPYLQSLEETPHNNHLPLTTESAYCRDFSFFHLLKLLKRLFNLPELRPILRESRQKQALFS